MKQIRKIIALLIGMLCAMTTAQQSLKTELFDMNVIMKYQTDIELTEAQKNKLKKIHNEHMARFNDAKWDLDAAVAKLDNQLSETSVQEKQAFAQMETVNALENQLKMTRLQMLVKMKNVLTASQLESLKSLRTDSDMAPTSFITSINDGQKIKLQVSKKTDSENEPLFIIKRATGDQAVDRDFMNAIKPNDIESVNVLKGKSATTIYGERGKNGVIVIKLKQK